METDQYYSPFTYKSKYQGKIKTCDSANTEGRVSISITAQTRRHLTGFWMDFFQEYLILSGDEDRCANDSHEQCQCFLASL